VDDRPPDHNISPCLPSTNGAFLCSQCRRLHVRTHSTKIAFGIEEGLITFLKIWIRLDKLVRML